MRQNLCPRCDSVLDRNGHCAICNYQVKVSCSCCGHANIPTAKFCGGCGKGRTVSVRYRRKVNSLFNPFQQIKIKRFFAGIAFGTLLALFACSSMGMKYSTSEEFRNVQKEIPEVKSVLSEEVLDSHILKKVSSDLEDFCLERKEDENASSGELNAIIDILIRNLNHIAQRVNKTRQPLDTAHEYLEQKRNIKQGEKATRGISGLMFFAYLSDLLELQYKDYAKGSNYSDIPRFNYMEAPSTALKHHSIKIAASDKRFGVNDEITLGELCDAAKQVTALAIERANKSAPDLTTPPEITIE